MWWYVGGCRYTGRKGSGGSVWTHVDGRDRSRERSPAFPALSATSAPTRAGQRNVRERAAPGLQWTTRDPILTRDRVRPWPKSDLRAEKRLTKHSRDAS